MLVRCQNPVLSAAFAPSKGKGGIFKPIWEHGARRIFQLAKQNEYKLRFEWSGGATPPILINCPQNFSIGKSGGECVFAETFAPDS
jgi:hypothetical protein